MRVEVGGAPVIQVSQTGELRIMRYELGDYEWAAIGGE
jgi:hypothetical protein